MKKYLLVFLILLLLTGCNAQNNHSHIQCLECGKCIVEDCIGLEDEKCQGHQPVHTHTQCPECGKCIAVECDGLKEEKCQGHQPVHTHTQCPECGKCIAEDCDGIEEDKCTGHQHYIYKLTIIDEENFIYDKPVETNCESDTKIVMHSRPIIDADLAMYINGEFHSIQNTIIVNGETVWEYSFIMPERDTTIEFKTQELEEFNVKTILGIPSLTREDILRITEKNINLSSTPESNLIPGSLRIVFSSTDYEDITSMLGFLNRTVVEDRNDNWQDDTGQCNKYSIYTIDKKYDFEITNGYISVNNKHYKLLGYEPGINYVSITWAFNTNLDSYEAYTLDGTKIGDYNGLSEFEFYEIDSPLTGVDDYGYLETEFGRIYIHDLKTFYIKDGENYTYYKLAWEKEKDFSDIFNKHTHTECQECGKCIATDCDGIIEEKCVCFENIFYIPNKNSITDISIINDWLNSSYNVLETPEYDVFTKYDYFYNLLPSQYSEKTGIYLIQTYTPSFCLPDYTETNSYTSLFIWNNGIVKLLYEGQIQDLTHGAIIDSNRDGFSELLISFNIIKKSNTIVVNDEKYSTIIIYDSKTNNLIQENYKYQPNENNFLFFKYINEDLGIYKSKEQNYDAAKLLFKKIIKNKYKYTFYKSNIFVECEEWEISVILEEGTINFPIYPEGYSLQFYAKTILKFKEELYTYNGTHGQKNGANLCFINENNIKFLCRKPWSGADMEYPEATLLKGEIIVENYYYELSTNEKVVGEYYLDIGFGSIINNQQIEKCLCIVYIK